MDGGDDPAAGHWRCPGDGSSFVHMLGGTDDIPLELVRDGGGGSTQWCPPAIPERGLPPSEDVMAAWLYPIVSGEDKDCTVDDSLKALTAVKEPAIAMGTMMATESSKGKLPATDVMPEATKDTNSSERRKASSSRKSSSAHNMAEKRRRCRIAEKLRTLQQLVPGCDHKSSQASTLDQTIQYMRSLQQQLQSMSTSWQAPPASAYPVVQTPPAPTLSMPISPAATFRPGVVPMVPFGAMFPYPHYRALMMPAAASASPLYPHTQAGGSTAAPDATGEHAQCSVSMEQQ